MTQLLLSLPADHRTDGGQKFFTPTLLSFWVQACALTIMLVLPAGCGLHKKMTIVSAAALVEDVAKASYKQSDLRLVREGMPAYLMLMDGMVEGWPDNERLLLAAAQAYSSYATAFVGADDAAFRDVLLLRAKTYALLALAQRGI